ncbi:MAG: membrane protein [Candidatus Neomarinimicrobiota bacterium]|nr:MAG: membrane protein [Candidatus Neomarinimicrobiota bacterium]GIT56762.1 MAG: membrane protein [Candidatus Neomarinimicrobiota bacterium]
MRSANPALNSKTFSSTRNISNEQPMTIDGTVNKTALSLLLLMTSAIYTWNNLELSFIYFLPIIISTFVLLLITIFNKRAAPYTVPIYCLLEGGLLGGISAWADAMYPGIANQAICLTFGILAALLMLYKSKLIAVTDNFRLGIFAATFGIFIVYMLNILLSSLFEISFANSLFSNDLPGILFSVFVVGIASLNLVLDFDFIEQGANQGAPKYMEWYGAFGLMITLIWLYIEILNLLMKLRSRR